MPHLAIRIQFSVSGIVLNRLPADIVPYSFSVTKVRHFFTLEHVRSVPVQVLPLLRYRVTWGKAPPFGDDLSLTYLFASSSEKSYVYVTNYMLCV